MLLKSVFEALRFAQKVLSVALIVADRLLKLSELLVLFLKLLQVLVELVDDGILLV